MTTFPPQPKTNCVNHPEIEEFVYIESPDFTGSLCEECHKNRINLRKAKKGLDIVRMA